MSERSGPSGKPSMIGRLIVPLLLLLAAIVTMVGVFQRLHVLSSLGHLRWARSRAIN